MIGYQSIIIILDYGFDDSRWYELLWNEMIW
jgi:hypothetical protein